MQSPPDDLPRSSAQQLAEDVQCTDDLETQHLRFLSFTIHLNKFRNKSYFLISLANVSNSYICLNVTKVLEADKNIRGHETTLSAALRPQIVHLPCLYNLRLAASETILGRDKRHRNFVISSHVLIYNSLSFPIAWQR